MVKRKKEGSVEVDINDVRSTIRAEISKRYGSVAKFIQHEDSEKFGGRKIRCYLYDSGAVNFKVIAELSQWLGIGELSRDVIVTRRYKYLLSGAGK